MRKLINMLIMMAIVVPASAADLYRTLVYNTNDYLNRGSQVNSGP